MLLTLPFVAASNPQQVPSKLPKVKIPKPLVVPAPLKPLSSQTSLLRPMVSSSIISSQPSLNLPILPRPNLDFWVKECKNIPDIPVIGNLTGAAGFHHSWLVVEDQFGHSVHAAGLGSRCGVPWKSMFVRNHTEYVPRTCKLLPTVNPLCVIPKTPYNQHIPGIYLPVVHDCNTFTRHIVNGCQQTTISATSRLSTKLTTVWDKFSLLPKPEAPKYRLLDVDPTKSTLPKTKSR